MAAAGGDVDDLSPGPRRAPLDDEVEIVALRVGLRITVSLRPLVPQFSHAVSERRIATGDRAGFRRPQRQSHGGLPSGIASEAAVIRPAPRPALRPRASSVRRTGCPG